MKIKNREALDEFFNKSRQAGHVCYGIKGKPPENMKYGDGTPVSNFVNVAWKNLTTGEIFEIEYE